MATGPIPLLPTDAARASVPSRPKAPSAGNGQAAGSSATIELLRNHSLATLVRQELERRILAGEIAPGTKLNEADVAVELGVSRGPVREAFRGLEQAGLVRVEKNRGVFVRELSVAEADELYEVRAGLDALAGKLAAARIDATQVQQLRELLRAMQRAARARDVDAYYPLNVRFHDLLVAITGNATLQATYRRLVNELHLFRRETLAHGQDSFPISTAEHAAVVEALAAREGERAALLLYEHAMRSRERLHQTLERPAGQAPARRAANPRKSHGKH
jgi:phosphonate utilization transcriptional regulator